MTFCEACAAASAMRSAVARAPAYLWQHVFERVAPATGKMRGTRAGLTSAELLRCQNLLEDPVDDEVRVAANGTCEVAVRRSTEGIVPLVSGLVEGALHRRGGEARWQSRPAPVRSACASAARMAAWSPTSIRRAPARSITPSSLKVSAAAWRWSGEGGSCTR